MGKIYGVAPGTPFIKTLADHLWASAGQDIAFLAKMWIILPTQHGCFSLQKALLELKNPLILSHLMTLAELEKRGNLTHELPPVMSTLEQQGLLIQLLQKSPFGKQTQSLAFLKALASDLMSLLEEAEIAEIDLRTVHTLDTENLSQYWQQTVDFLKIITEHWPKVLASLGKITAAQQQRLIFDGWCQLWQEKPPDFPIIFAGSTGIRPATARLMKIIRHLPQGELILAEFDASSLNLPLPPSHPLYGVKQLLTYLGDKFSQVEVLGTQLYSPFLRSLMQPAGGIPQWEVSALPDVIPLVCSTQTLEARTIAIIAREAQQEQKTVSIITSDLVLTQHIEGELRRWNINPIISYGTPLRQTPIGVFFLLTAEFLQTAKVTTLLALLKHPFCCFPKENMSLWEKELREKAIAVIDVNDIPFWLAPLQNWILQAPSYPASLHAILRHHQALIRLLSGEIDTSDVLLGLYQTLNEAAISFPHLYAYDYVTLLHTLLLEKTIPSTASSHVTILGRLEACLLYSDIIVIAGCNEGNWPPRLSPNPWLTSKQRQQLGLAPLETLIGRAAYDFSMALSAPRVFVTRALSVGGSPTIPSRWFERLQALMSLQPSLPTKQPWVEWAQHLDSPTTFTSLSVPKPCPPVHARPSHISVSGVQRLIGDPYAYYASSILRLRPLACLERSVTAKDWGKLVHKAIHDFTQKNLPPAAPHAAAVLYALGAQAIDLLNPQPTTRYFLLHRWEKLSLWLVEQWRNYPFIAYWSEIKGQATLGNFQLTAIADRLELASDGTLRVIDFKTGAVPSYREVKQGLTPQLPLEGMLVMKGAFVDTLTSNVLTLMYWQLSGYGDTLAEVSELKDPLVLIEEAMIGVEKLLNYFAAPTVPYTAAPEVNFPDYEPLIRRQEWFGK